jgi:hypothetical protein
MKSKLSRSIVHAETERDPAGIAFLFAADPDHADCIVPGSKASKKSWMNAKKKKTRHPDYSIELIKTVEH